MDFAQLCIYGAVVLWIIGELWEYFPSLDPKWKNISFAVNSFAPAKGSWLSKQDKPVLVLINPVAGGGDGATIGKRIIEPMLEKAGLKAEIIVTERAGHAEDVVKGMDLASKCMVLVCGGDSTLCEVISGVATKPEVDMDPVKLKAALAGGPCIALLPGGTSNGFCKSFGATAPFDMMKQILDAPAPRQVDLLQMDIDGKPACFDAHVISWAMIADHDRLAEETLRFMGPMLKSLAAPIWVIARAKQYAARVGFVPAPGKPPAGYDDPAAMPASEERGPFEGARLVDDEVLLLSACNLAWAQHDVHLAPGAAPDDGAVDVCFIRGGCSRLNILKTFLGLEKAQQLQQPWFETYKVDRLVIEPRAGTSIGTFDTSGKLLKTWGEGCKVAEIRSLPKALKTLV
mmetsp:Transcript_30246/g.96748  ORF Transcript_30246/g.96748 Transcript_30246/m.96748 type:complete len:401 (+) Transcript_30246:37-1239(+)